MGTNTRVFDRKIKAQQAQARLKDQQAQSEDEELHHHLRAAAKGMAINVGDLSPAAELALLEDYAQRLAAEAAAFLEAWPDAKHAHEWFVMARSSVLKQIAQRTIDHIQKEYEPMETEQ